MFTNTLFIAILHDLIDFHLFSNVLAQHTCFRIGFYKFLQACMSLIIFNIDLHLDIHARIAPTDVPTASHLTRSRVYNRIRPYVAP